MMEFLQKLLTAFSHFYMLATLVEYNYPWFIEPAILSPSMQSQDFRETNSKILLANSKIQQRKYLCA